MTKREREYPAVKGDDGRVQYCPSCELDGETLPGEGVPNQALRCCAYCGSYTEECKAEEPITEVVFRVWLGDDFGAVIALFPYVQGRPNHCESFMHVGQHASADYIGLVGGGWDRRTRPATAEEYKSLKLELESSPYNYRLKVIQRVNYAKHREAVTAK